MRYELGIHYLVLTSCSICKLVNSFTWTKLHEELREAFNYLMSLQANLGFVACNQTQKNLFETWMGYEVCEYVNVALTHK